MRVLGIDPGIATTGYGVVDFGPDSNGVNRYQPTAHDYGCILTAKEDTVQERLSQLYRHMQSLLESTKPDVVVVEKLFFNTNVTTAMAVGQARGVVLLAAHQRGIPIAEYTPLQVKGAVCGYGRAKKPQVQQMVQTLLRLQAIPKPDDAADALAIALCHTNSGMGYRG